MVTLVVGIGCSGTSCVAGVAHKLGVPMHLPGHSNVHPMTGAGLYEDECFYGLFAQQPTPSRIERAKKLIAQHERDVWGLKNTKLGAALPWFLPLVGEARVIAVHRTLVACAMGRAEGKCAIPFGKTYAWGDACEWAVNAKSAMLAGVSRAAERGVAVHHVSFEHLIARPEREVVRIADFLVLDATDEALAHVRPELKHN